MITPYDCTVQFCPVAMGARTHIHPASQIDQIGEHCPCGGNHWMLYWSGSWPAHIYCGDCGAGFNLAERLRTAKRDLPAPAANA